MYRFGSKKIIGNIKEATIVTDTIHGIKKTSSIKLKILKKKK